MNLEQCNRVVGMLAAGADLGAVARAVGLDLAVLGNILDADRIARGPIRTAVEALHKFDQEARKHRLAQVMVGHIVAAAESEARDDGSSIESIARAARASLEALDPRAFQPVAAAAPAAGAVVNLSLCQAPVGSESRRAALPAPSA